MVKPLKGVLDRAQFPVHFASALPDPNDHEAARMCAEEFEDIKSRVILHVTPLLDSALRHPFNKDWFSWSFFVPMPNGLHEESFIYLNENLAPPSTPEEYKKIWDSSPTPSPYLTIWERRHKNKFQTGIFRVGVQRNIPRAVFKEHLMLHPPFPGINVSDWVDRPDPVPRLLPQVGANDAQSSDSESEVNADGSGSSASTVQAVHRADPNCASAADQELAESTLAAAALLPRALNLDEPQSSDDEPADVSSEDDDIVPIADDFKTLVESQFLLPDGRKEKPYIDSVLAWNNANKLRIDVPHDAVVVDGHKGFAGRLWVRVSDVADIVPVPDWPDRYTVVAKTAIKAYDTIFALNLNEKNFTSAPANQYPSPDFKIFKPGGVCEGWLMSYTFDLQRARLNTRPQLVHFAKNGLPLFIGYCDTHFNGSTCCLTLWPDKTTGAATHLLLKAKVKINPGEKLTIHYGPGYVGYKSEEALERALANGSATIDYPKASERLFRNVLRQWAALQASHNMKPVEPPKCKGPCSLQFFTYLFVE